MKERGRGGEGRERESEGREREGEGREGEGKGKYKHPSINSCIRPCLR